MNLSKKDFTSLEITSGPDNLNDIRLEFINYFFSTFVVDYFLDFVEASKHELDELINGTTSQVEQLIFEFQKPENKKQEKFIRKKIQSGKQKKYFSFQKKALEENKKFYLQKIENFKKLDGKYNIGELIDFSFKFFSEIESYEPYMGEIFKVSSAIKDFFIFIVINNIKKESIKINLLKENSIELKEEFDYKKIAAGADLMMMYFSDKLKSSQNNNEKINILYKNSLIQLSNLERENSQYKTKINSLEVTNEFLTKQLESKDETTNITKEKLRKSESMGFQLTQELENLKKSYNVIFEENQKLKENISGDVNSESWQEIAQGFDIENQFLSVENTKLSDTVAKQFTQIQVLEKRLAILLEENFDSVKLLKFKIENELEKCSNDDIIKYIVNTDCPILYKQRLVEILLDFLDFFIASTAKGASSSTNTNTFGEKGAGGGAYANNFVNPIINFIREKYYKNGTIPFLEYISEMNWKKIIEEYRSGDVSIAVNKRQSIFLKVYNALTDEQKETGFFDSLSLLALTFDTIDHGNLDLSVLSENIINSLNKSGLREDLISLIKEIQNKK